MYKLSVIIPFRCETESTEHLLLRLRDLCFELSESAPKDIEFIVIDSGSAERYQLQCQDICQEYGIRYLYHNTLGKAFSIGSCRDFGVQHAQGQAVSFLDVDLRVAPDFWIRLLTLMQNWGIGKYKKSFLAIPCLYLTQDGTSEFLTANSENKFTDFYLRYLQGDNQAIENMAFCSSVMIVDRNHYLSIGGHDLAFRGHGYEDFELYHRLLCEEDIIPKSQDYYLDQKTWNTSTYKGFRSHLAIIARPAMMMNLFVIHLWHPRPKDASFYSPKSLTENRTIWEDKFKQFVETGIHPEALVLSENSQNNILFFGKSYQSPSALSLKAVFPFMGKVIYVDENNFIDRFGQLDEGNLSNLLNNYQIKKIIFPNPYGNEARLAIYKYCRNNHFPFYCYDRGALPDSWFFDSNGFNADSASYQTDFWNKPLNENEQQKVKNYIYHCLNDAPALEKQDTRIGGELLAQKLQLGGKKVLFVPMQRPSDTVIKYMAGNIQSFIKFMNVIDLLASHLKSKGWVVLCKKHPLETEVPQLRYAQYVPENTHFVDLLELSDRVALINSGVGVYAMMMKKPCFIFGDAFYAHDELNQSIKYLDFETENDIEKVVQKIITGFDVNEEKMHRFIHYLIEEFYSFGKPKTISRKEKDGSLRTITTGIDFYRLRLENKTIFEYESQSRPRLNLSAPIFERYALDIHMQKKSVSSKVATTSPKNAPPTAKTAQPTIKKTEQPKAEQPKAEQPKAEQPKAEQPKAEQPKAEQPKAEQPIVVKAEQQSPPPTVKVEQIIQPIQSSLLEVTGGEKKVTVTDTKQQLVESILTQKKSKSDIQSAKLRKLVNNPHDFFADSKNPIIRSVATLFKK